MRLWELADALLDRHDEMSDFASKALAAVARRAHRSTSRRVDWEPARDTLRRLTDGTNLFEFDTLVEVLVLTDVSPRLAAPLLSGGGGDLLLAAAGSSDRVTREHARARGGALALSIARGIAHRAPPHVRCH